MVMHDVTRTGGLTRVGAPIRRLRWRSIRGFFFILPWLIGFVLFTLGPFLGALYLSFTQWRLVGPITWVGLDNYIELLTDDPRFVKSLVNTVYYLSWHVPGTLLLAFAAAGLLNRPVRGIALFRTMFYLPAITSGVATAVLWVWILQPNGILNTVLSWLGLPGPNWLNSTIWAMPGLILMSLWTIGTPMVLFLAGLQGIPQHLYEAASIDGAGWWGKVRHVTIPMMTPTILLTLVISIIDSFQVFTAALVLTNGGPGDTTLFVLLYLYTQGFQNLRVGYAAAIAWVLFGIILVCTLVQLGLARYWVYYEGEQGRA